MWCKSKSSVVREDRAIYLSTDAVKLVNELIGIDKIMRSEKQ